MQYITSMGGLMRNVERPMIIHSLDQVLACTDSATSDNSATSQCLSALLGRPERVMFILNGLRWKKKPKHLSLLYDHYLATQHP